MVVQWPHNPSTCSPPSSRSVAGLHQGGAGDTRTAGELWQAVLESHEAAGGGECGEICFQLYAAPDRTPLNTACCGPRQRCNHWGMTCRFMQTNGEIPCKRWGASEFVGDLLQGLCSTSIHLVLVEIFNHSVCYLMMYTWYHRHLFLFDCNNSLFIWY